MVRFVLFISVGSFQQSALVGKLLARALFQVSDARYLAGHLPHFPEDRSAGQLCFPSRTRFLVPGHGLLDYMFIHLRSFNRRQLREEITTFLRYRN